MGDEMSWESKVNEWIQADPNPKQAQELAEQLATNPTAVRSAFAGRLRFGTAGMRGQYGLGPNKMNRVTVRRVACALAHYLEELQVEGPVVIGFDGRHLSDVFAEDCARVIASLARRVYLFDIAVPTPRVAHAIKPLGCAAGIVITASHNPPKDNGVKVFFANGSQIIAPHDAKISDYIDALALPLQPPSARSLELAGLVSAVPQRVTANYFHGIQYLRTKISKTTLRAVYTPLHGVGWPSVQRALHEADHDQVFVVPRQADPDPEFSTVSFPNPEEEGALDLAYEQAEALSAKLVIANDPDADRLAVAVKEEGGWRRLSGNEVGLLLAEHVLANTAGEERLVVTTVVSSSALEHLARAHGVHYRSSLTGFKWISEAARDGEAAGERFVFGYEEALGYTIGTLVRDKDGISAAVLLMDLASLCSESGGSLTDELNRIAERDGLFVTEMSTMRLADLSFAMQRLRGEGLTEIAGHKVLQTTDYLNATVTTAEGATSTYDGPKTNLLRFDLEKGITLKVRPSGTEPKLKLYCEARVLASERAEGDRRVQAVLQVVRALLNDG